MSERRRGHRWQPISDLTDQERGPLSAQLDALLAVWRQQRLQLQGTAVLEKFQARLVRSWSMETGILERLYSLSEGITLTFLEQGFDASLVSHDDSDTPPQQLVAILRDHQEVAEGLFAFVKGSRQLSTSYVRELHQVLTRHQATCDAVDPSGQPVQVPLLRGAWKLQPNNPGSPDTAEVVHEYCPPEQVASEMDRLLAMQATHGKVSFVVSAAWLHHRFTQVHPFQDGNGRVARALASLLCIQAGGFPVVVYRQQKIEYIRALEQADDGDLTQLASLFEQQQRAALVRAIGLSHQVLEEKLSLEAIVADAKRRLEAADAHGGRALVESVARLVDATRQRLGDVASSVASALAARVQAEVFSSDEKTEPWFRSQIIATAKSLGYYANLSGPKPWVQLRLRHVSTTSLLVVSFHHIGRLDANVMVATAFLASRDGSDEDPASPAGGVLDTETACTEAFTFTAGRSAQELQAEFSTWLDGAVTLGLDLWRRSL